MNQSLKKQTFKTTWWTAEALGCFLSPNLLNVHTVHFGQKNKTKIKILLYDSARLIQPYC